MPLQAPIADIHDFLHLLQFLSLPWPLLLLVEIEGRCLFAPIVLQPSLPMLPISSNPSLELLLAAVEQK